MIDCPPKIIVQCDFDGTVTIEDVSFVLLNAFAPDEWYRLLEQYHSGVITVGAFNTSAFGLVKANRKTMVDFVNRADIKIRPGLPDLLETCAGRGIEFAVVSNGLEFYIKVLLRNLGMSRVPVFAARSRFHARGMKVTFTGPDGSTIDDDFKTAYLEYFRSRGCRVWYVGNGSSDLAPARRADRIFATGDLLESCRKLGLPHIRFEDFYDVAREIQKTPSEM